MRRYQKSLIWGILLLVFLLMYLAIKFPSIQDDRLEIFNTITAKISEWLPNVIIVLIIIIFTNLVINLSSHFITKYFEKKGKKEADLFLVLIVYKYIVWFLAIMVSLSVLFRNFASLLTSLGLIGFGITFALQKPLLNFVGWLSIIANGPFKIGERIMINNARGDVFSIRVMYTYLREVNNNDELTGRVVSIPNEYVLTYHTTNFTRGTPYVWEDINFSITYESNWKRAMKIVEDSADDVVGSFMKKLANDWKSLPRRFDPGTNILDKPAVSISLAESWINIKVRYLVDIRSKRGINSRLNTLILERFGKTKAVKLAYPHLHLVSGK